MTARTSLSSQYRFRARVAAALAAAVILAGGAAAPLWAQQSYTSIQGHQPIWAPSVHGGYYDMTGGIQGAVPEAELWRYGGRFADGRPVSGFPRVRNSTGRLLSEGDYDRYRKAVERRLSRLDRLERDMIADGRSSWELNNLHTERQQLLGELAALNASVLDRASYRPLLPDSTFSDNQDPWLAGQYIPTYPNYSWRQGSKQALLNQVLGVLGQFAP